MKVDSFISSLLRVAHLAVDFGLEVLAMVEFHLAVVVVRAVRPARLPVDQERRDGPFQWLARVDLIVAKHAALDRLRKAATGPILRGGMTTRAVQRLVGMHCVTEDRTTRPAPEPSDHGLARGHTDGNHSHRDQPPAAASSDPLLSATGFHVIAS